MKPFEGKERSLETVLTADLIEGDILQEIIACVFVPHPPHFVCDSDRLID